MRHRAAARLSWLSTAMSTVVMGLVLSCLAWPLQAIGQAQATEQQVKAAFLFQFGGYVEWPADAFSRPDSPLGIGVIGADGVAGELASTAARRTLNGRPVVVHRLVRGDSMAGLHVLFVGRAERAHLAAVQSSIRHKAVLLVTEDEQSFDGGSMLNFVMQEGKVRFDVALPRAEAAGLKISARLLNVARKVIGRPAS